MTKRKAILLTFTAWLVGVSVYGYWYITSILSQPGLHGYERWPIFPIFGFLVDRFIYLFIALLVALYAEAILFETYARKQRAT